MDGCEGEAVRAENLLAERQLFIGGIDDLNLCRGMVFHNGHARVDGANVDDAECRCFLHAITSFLEWERLWADEPVSYYREQAAGLRCYFVNFLLIPYIIQHLTEILNCLEASRLN